MIAPFTPFMIVPPPCWRSAPTLRRKTVLPQLPINEMTDTELMVQDTDTVVTGEYEEPREHVPCPVYAPCAFAGLREKHARALRACEPADLGDHCGAAV